MRYLVVADIHANAQALTAVLESAPAHDRIVCCGDLVGYGGEPNEVVDWARSSGALVVRGNHDRVAAGIDDYRIFKSAARASAVVTRQLLTEANREYLAGLPAGPLDAGGFCLVHGSPDGEDQYLAATRFVAPLLPKLEYPLYFFGHTHLQGGYALRRSLTVKLSDNPQAAGEILPEFRGYSGVFDLRQARPDETETLLRLVPGAIYLINPGSVGQPRDRDPRAAYCLYDSAENLVRYYRVPYDIGAAQRRIRERGLVPDHAKRLEAGK